jgi:Ca2+:H+ antiporter
MADGGHDWNRIPAYSWVGPAAGVVLLGAKFAYILPIGNGFVIAIAVAVLTATVFAAVHHAEVLAARIGQPFGAILLALAITIIEVGLIISVMASGAPESGSIARDTVFSVVIIVLNGIVGLCLVVGAARHYEQHFRLQGAVGILSVIATLAIVSLVLPNYTETSPGPTYTPGQLLFVGADSLILYLLFIFVQTVLHRSDFIIEDDGSDPVAEPPGARVTALSALLLLASLVVVILLAKTLSPNVEKAVFAAGLPPSFVGVVIALIVLLPEGLTAMRAASKNLLQTSLNASLGSAAASIGLTIPIVGATSIYFGQPLTLGLDQGATAMLVLTLFISSLTFATGRTNVLQGIVHLVIFGVFLFLSAVP